MIGGAENLLVNSLSTGGLQQYTDNTVVYFYGTSVIEKKIDNNIKIICLNYKGIKDLPRVLLLLRKIIKENKIDIVHSHLNPAGFYTNLALPKGVKQVHTLHTIYSKNSSTRPTLLKLEKYILFKSKKVSLIFLSETLKKDFLTHINFKGRTFVLNNFIEDIFFTPSLKKENNEFKIIAVGNLNPVKNYLYLCEIFNHLKDTPVSLDIYGGGDIEKYQELIDKEKLSIKLMGLQTDIHNVLPQYDLFIMASKYEGYPVSVLEAMAMGLPCMLSDIESLRSTANKNAIYFSLDNAKAVADTIKKIADKKIDITSIAEKGKLSAQKARRKIYLEKLMVIYKDIAYQTQKHPIITGLFKTIKLNKDYWKKKIPFLKFGVPNPLLIFSNNEEKFSQALTAFRFEQVFKTTRTNRHYQTQSFLMRNLSAGKKPVILDIGASDGSTSLNFIELLNQSFSKYYVTDYNIKCQYISDRGYTYFFDEANYCFLIASNRLVLYPVNKWYFNIFFKKKLDKLKHSNKTELILSNRKLLELQENNSGIEIMKYNIFEPWEKEKADIIIVGNLLNKSYFSDTLITAGLMNCYKALSENGMLAIIRNELIAGNEVEKSTIYSKENSGCFKKIHEINGGVDINDLILSLQCN